jgi:Transposase DDE domain
MVPSPVPLDRRACRTISPFIARAAATPGADRYRKTFTAQAHLWMLLLHFWWGSQSLRQTYGRLSGCAAWLALWGMDHWISFSQFARSSTSRPRSCAETLFAEALAAARDQHPTDRQWRLLSRVQAIDSTFLRLSATLSPWSQHKRAVPGVRLQTSLDLVGRIPSRLRMTTGEINDHAALRQLDLTGWTGWTLLVDRGYYGHQQLARLIEAGVHFVAACSEQAHYQVVRSHQPPAGLTPDGDTISADAVVVLGSPHNRRGAVIPNLRLIGITTRSGKRMKLVTDRHDLRATQVVRLYRKRWQIELFFRWLKRQLGVIRPLGRSKAAIELTLVLAVAVVLLLLLLDAHRPPDMSRIAYAGALATTLLLSVVINWAIDYYRTHGVSPLDGPACAGAGSCDSIGNEPGPSSRHGLTRDVIRFEGMRHSH